jgi:4-hydroxybenzoate polyprenyltransferase
MKWMSQAAPTQIFVSSTGWDLIGHALTCMRPYQWTKNLLVFAALIFSGSLTKPTSIAMSVVAFALFCLLSSAIYVFNDVRDMESDRLHPEKCRRPIAVGALSPKVALCLAIALAVPSLAIAAAIDRSFFFSLAGYSALNICYSLGLKKVVILDVFCIGLGFVLRTVAGAFIIGVVPSDWLILCTLSMALLVGFGKRRHEVGLLRHEAALHRATLEEYTLPFVNAMVIMLAAVVIVTYCIYAISDHHTSIPGSTAKLVFTTPMVFYGVLRYLYLTMQAEQGGDPARLLITDLPTLLNCVAWAMTACITIYAAK